MIALYEFVKFAFSVNVGEIEDKWLCKFIHNLNITGQPNLYVEDCLYYL